MHTESQREQTNRAAGVLMASNSHHWAQKANRLTVSTLWEKEKERDGELLRRRGVNLMQTHSAAAVRWYNNHNEATPANLHSAEPLFNQKAVFLRHTLFFGGFFFWSSKLQKKSTRLWSRIVYKLYWVFRSWHIGSVCIRWGTWFIAAVIGPVWWVISLAQYLSPHFPQLGKDHRVPCRLFYTGVRFLERSALGSQLPLWLRKRPRFIRVGMVFIRLAYCAAWMEVRACVWETRHASSQL